jgi:hypothetical protein
MAAGRKTWPVMPKELSSGLTLKSQPFTTVVSTDSFPVNIPILEPRLYMPHDMAAFEPFTDLRSYLTEHKRVGYNTVWLFTDSYAKYDGSMDSAYWYSTKRYLDMADSLGLKVILGTQSDYNQYAAADVYSTFWNHPAILKWKGKRIFAGYDYLEGSGQSLIAEMGKRGHTEATFEIWASTRYSEWNPSGNFWVDRYQNTPKDTAAVGRTIQQAPAMKGILGFVAARGNSGDYGLPVAGQVPSNVTYDIIHENELVAETAKNYGLTSVSGVIGFYASVNYLNFGFKGIGAMMKNIIAKPLDKRPNGITVITGNDYGELSYTSKVAHVSNGLFWMPDQARQPFPLGQNIRLKLTDHSGIEEFIKPWADAFVQNRTVPVITEDKMFAWYWIHTDSVKTSTGMPAEVAALNNPIYTQDYWNQTIYADSNSLKMGSLHYIKEKLSAAMNEIRMAAWLTAPAYLEIETAKGVYRSGLQPAGDAYWQCPQALGTPIFRIIRSGIVVKQASGPQPVTNNIYPGAFNPLIITLNNASVLRILDALL